MFSTNGKTEKYLSSIFHLYSLDPSSKSPKDLYTCRIFHVSVKYMVQAMIHISDEANQILNIVKAKYDLKDKSHAIEKVIIEYAGDFLEPQLRPEFIQKMKERQTEKTIKVKDFRKHFGLN